MLTEAAARVDDPSTGEPDGTEVRTPRSGFAATWWAPIALVTAWVAANAVWLAVHRRSGLFDHEEVGYATTLVRLGRHRSPSSIWDTTMEGYTGPLQPLVGAPAQWLLGVDPAGLYWESLAFGAGIGLATYWLARRLGGPVPGLVAAAGILVTSGVLENARGGLTMVPATFFATLAMAALAVGPGLRRRRWALLAGVAVGAMLLSRSMTVAFVPPLALAAWGWSRTSGTPTRLVVRNGALAAATALVVAGWWWVLSFDEVSEYLGSGAASVATASPPVVLASRLAEIVLYLGVVAPLVGGVAYLVLRRRVEAPPAEEARDPGEVALWPLWAAVGTAVVVSLASNTLGWLMLPVVPWLVAAAVVGAHRRLDRARWRTWVGLSLGSALAVALLTSVVAPVPGNRFTWCLAPLDESGVACGIDDAAEAARWRDAIDRLTDDLFATHEALRTEGATPELAVAARDHIVLPSAIGLAAELRHRWAMDGYAFFQPGTSHDEQIAEVLDRADVVVVVPDVEPVVLATHAVDPDRLAAELRAGGFATCTTETFPDGRVGEILVRAPQTLPTCR